MIEFYGFEPFNGTWYTNLVDSSWTYDEGEPRPYQHPGIFNLQNVSDAGFSGDYIFGLTKTNLLLMQIQSKVRKLVDVFQLLPLHQESYVI